MRLFFINWSPVNQTKYETRFKSASRKNDHTDNYFKT